MKEEGELCKDQLRESIARDMAKLMVAGTGAAASTAILVMTIVKAISGTGGSSKRLREVYERFREGSDMHTTIMRACSASVGYKEEAQRLSDKYLAYMEGKGE